MKEVSIILFYGMTAFAVVVFLFTLDIFSFSTITGKGISGNLSLFIEDVSQVKISSPLNTTYNFNVDEPYAIDLNVSAVFDVAEWKYSLYDLTNKDYIFINQSFSPNITFNATRWGNRLTVFAQRADESWAYKEVIFFVNVPNSAPILGYVNDEILVCEGRGLYYSFNASDIDRDTLTSDISPKNPFYTNYVGRANETVSLFNIISGTLRKSRVGTGSYILSVNDNYNSSCCIDTKSVNITVIEINNIPIMQGIGAQTVWTRGENSTFYHQMSVSDVEDGDSNSGNLSFNISFSEQENLFGIDGFGIMNYTPEANQVGVYEVRVCVNDNPIEDIHENISLCYPRGGYSESVCDDFSITVTDQNRIPQIVNYTPIEKNFTVSGTDIVSFNLEVYDPDGTIPDIDWYVDGILKQHTEMNSLDSFNYIFGCDVAGEHNVSVVVSDGLLNVSLIWNITVNLVVCPPVREGGGGGGGGRGYCIENWVCDEWSTCQNLKRSFNIGTIYQKDYYDYNEICLQKGLPEFFCGYQIRNCSDLDECNNSVFRAVKPSEIQVCYFTEEPGCFDEIKNCHSGGCELLIDCGGPCTPCPTCSDGIQNQGEAGIDCGGPCPFSCEKEIPFKFNWLLIILLLLLILIIIFIIIKLRNIIRDTKRDKFSLIKSRQ
jgi:hypothetical protein